MLREVDGWKAKDSRYLPVGGSPLLIAVTWQQDRLGYSVSEFADEECEMKGLKVRDLVSSARP